jgi:hypothetical protein
MKKLKNFSLSLSLSLSFGTIQWEKKNNFPWKHIIKLSKLFVSSHDDQRAQHVICLYKQCVDLNEHSCTFGQGIHLTTQSHSLFLSHFIYFSIIIKSFLFKSQYLCKPPKLKFEGSTDRPFRDLFRTQRN